MHFMDHPDFPIMDGALPREYMEKGDRLRAWVKDVDEERGRVSLTGNRPEDLPRLSWE